MQLLRLSLLLLSLALPVGAMAGASSDTVCQRLAKQVRQLQAAHPHVDIDSIGSKELCFEACEPGQVSVQSLVASASPDEMKDVQAELEASLDWVARVSRKDLNGDGQQDVQVSRRVGTASCVRNTYLASSENGFRLLRSEAFGKLSEEAGNCGEGTVRLERLDGRPYIIEAFYGKLTAYLVGKDFGLDRVCSIHFSWSPRDARGSVLR
jgi:hypothetical protein